MLPEIRHDLDVQSDFVGKDLINLKVHLLGVEGAMGYQTQFLGRLAFPSIWRALIHLVENKTAMQNIWIQMSEINKCIKCITQHQHTIEECVTDHDVKFKVLGS
eukprot:12914607-Ditylum_brightwellii.AAC.1